MSFYINRLPYRSMLGFKNRISGQHYYFQPPKQRCFSLGPIPPETDVAYYARGGEISMTVLKRIQADLVEADVNDDGRVDFEELKMMLRKYPDTFSNDDIDRIGELFYVGRSGTSVRHLAFLRGIQHVMRQNGNNNGNHNENSCVVPRENPLQMESLDDKRCWVSPEEAAASGEQFYNIQAQFDQTLSEYANAVSSKKKDPDS